MILHLRKWPLLARSCMKIEEFQSKSGFWIRKMLQFQNDLCMNQEIGYKTSAISYIRLLLMLNCLKLSYKYNYIVSSHWLEAIKGVNYVECNLCIVPLEVLIIKVCILISGLPNMQLMVLKEVSLHLIPILCIAWKIFFIFKYRLYRLHV